MKKFILFIILIIIALVSIDTFTSVNIKEGILSLTNKLPLWSDSEEESLNAKSPTDSLAAWLDVEKVNLDAKNSKHISDSRMIFKAIEWMDGIRDTKAFKASIQILSGNKSADNNAKIWKIYKWNPNYKILWIEKEDYLDPWGQEYEVGITNIGWENFIQILSFNRDIYWEAVSVRISWDQLPEIYANDIQSLFVKNDGINYFENGEYLSEVWSGKLSNKGSKLITAKSISLMVEMALVRQEIETPKDLISKIDTDYSTSKNVWLVWDLDYSPLDLDKKDFDIEPKIAYYENDFWYFQISIWSDIAWNYVQMDSSFPKNIFKK